MTGIRDLTIDELDIVSGGDGFIGNVGGSNLYDVGAGTLVRGVERRGVTSFGSRPLKKPKPGVKPTQATR